VAGVVARKKIEISFCTTCRGRLYQLRETLPHNLATLREDEEFVLVDYKSPDGLSEWVWANCRDAIDAGRLRFFEVLDEAPWHASKAKNLAYRISRGAFLFNLDGDNFILPQDTALIRAAKLQGFGARQGTGKLTDGTPGRIGMKRELFFDLGGYDEGLLGMTVQDYDIIVRAEATGYRFARLGPPARMPIQNGRTERLAQLLTAREPVAEDNTRMGQVNFAMHKMRNEMEGPRRRQNFSTFRGRLNGEDVIIDGLDNLHPVASQEN
jgi:hypothetical protein